MPAVPSGVGRTPINPQWPHTSRAILPHYQALCFSGHERSAGPASVAAGGAHRSRSPRRVPVSLAAPQLHPTTFLTGDPWPFRLEAIAAPEAKSRLQLCFNWVLHFLPGLIFLRLYLHGDKKCWSHSVSLDWWIWAIEQVTANWASRDSGRENHPLPVEYIHILGLEKSYRNHTNRTLPKSPAGRGILAPEQGREGEFLLLFLWAASLTSSQLWVVLFHLELPTWEQITSEEVTLIVMDFISLHGAWEYRVLTGNCGQLFSSPVLQKQLVYNKDSSPQWLLTDRPQGSQVTFPSFRWLMPVEEQFWLAALGMNPHSRMQVGWCGGSPPVQASVAGCRAFQVSLSHIVPRISWPYPAVA